MRWRHKYTGNLSFLAKIFGFARKDLQGITKIYTVPTYVFFKITYFQNNVTIIRIETFKVLLHTSQFFCLRYPGHRTGCVALVVVLRRPQIKFGFCLN